MRLESEGVGFSETLYEAMLNSMEDYYSWVGRSYKKESEPSYTQIST